MSRFTLTILAVLVALASTSTAGDSVSSEYTGTDTRAVNVCKQPKKVGPCKASIPRWYYDSRTGTCRKFSWGGCQPNGNNFPTVASCMKRCWVPVCKRPKKVGPCKAAIPRWYYDSRTGKCRKFSWGGCQPNGNNFPTFASCMKRCLVPVCKRPKKVGPCKAAIPRWYYDSRTGKCRKFVWGGCQSNGNNFPTFGSCMKRCWVPVCKRPKKVGPCRGSFKRYYYDSTQKKCKVFYWGGCRSNGNNFVSLVQCRKICQVCKQPKKVGPCKASIKRYYYDWVQKKCKVFYWGGCQPNANNFKTMADCNRICKGK